MQHDLFSDLTQRLDLPGAELAYYAGFIPQHQQYFTRLLESIDWQQSSITMYGRLVAVPRLSAWYGDAGTDYQYSGLTMTPKPWLNDLQALKQQLEQALHTRFNSVLANYYRDGQDSVAWHSDDEPELGATPLIASLSFGATRRFSLRSNINPQAAPVHLDLVSGSLLTMAGATQRNWQHQLAKTSRPVGGRINLTFRRILPVGQVSRLRGRHL